jgi:hypothetical protein
MDADKILREMEKKGGEVCNPLIVTSKRMPEWTHVKLTRVNSL